eukprot:scaffold36275_cov154-Isochrysis_galbana.AAC.26
MPNAAEAGHRSRQYRAHHTPRVYQLGRVAPSHADLTLGHLLEPGRLARGQLATTSRKHESLGAVLGQPLAREQPEPSGTTRQQVCRTKAGIGFRHASKALQARNPRCSARLATAKCQLRLGPGQQRRRGKEIANGAAGAVEMQDNCAVCLCPSTA